MFWLSRPPYLRWALAALLVAGGIVAEFRPSSTVSHPFATEPIEVGETVDDSRVTYRPVPAGLLEPVALPVTADRRLRAGEPVLAGDPEDDGGIPPGWWAIELDLPTDAAPGMTVRVVTPFGVADGVVVAAVDGDFGERRGLVAVPDGESQVVAEAVLDSRIAVLLGPGHDDG